MVLEELLGLPLSLAEQLLKEAVQAYETELYAFKEVSGAADLRVLRAVQKENRVKLLVSPFLTDLQAVMKKNG